MSGNMGSTDRTVRVVAAMCIGVLLLTGILEGVPAIVLGMLAVMLLLSSVIGFCLIYLPLKISTARR
jgi:hypothetical protein